MFTQYGIQTKFSNIDSLSNINNNYEYMYQNLSWSS